MSELKRMAARDFEDLLQVKFIGVSCAGTSSRNIYYCNITSAQFRYS